MQVSNGIKSLAYKLLPVVALQRLRKRQVVRGLSRIPLAEAPDLEFFQRFLKHGNWLKK